MIIDVVGVDESMNKGYIINIDEEIRRVLITKKGSIPMSPSYGSDLWRYKDRTLDAETRLGLINETFDAIELNIDRIEPTKAKIKNSDDGKFRLEISIQRREHASVA